MGKESGLEVEEEDPEVVLEVEATAAICCILPRRRFCRR